MVRNPFTPRFEALPESLPIFPLAGAILLPRGQLPLNIFEPRYLNMTLDALGGQRLIGMVQPDFQAGEEGVFRTGCAGRISRFSETDDGRLLIVLAGVCRFRVAEELTPRRGYRRVAADWSPFRADLEEVEPPTAEMAPLLDAVTRFCEARELEVDWESVRAMEPIALVDFLAINLPFGVDEKQGLVEAVTPVERARLLTGLASFGATGDQWDGSRRH